MGLIDLIEKIPICQGGCFFNNKDGNIRCVMICKGFDRGFYGDTLPMVICSNSNNVCSNSNNEGIVGKPVFYDDSKDSILEILNQMKFKEYNGGIAFEKKRTKAFKLANKTASDFVGTIWENKKHYAMLVKYLDSMNSYKYNFVVVASKKKKDMGKIGTVLLKNSVSENGGAVWTWAKFWGFAYSDLKLIMEEA